TLIATDAHSLLTNITLAGTLDLATNIASVDVSGGLSLPGGLIRVGNASGSTFGHIFFVGGNQTIAGTAGNPGTVLFGGNTDFSNRLISENGSAVTFGPNLTVTGATGSFQFTTSFDIPGTITAHPTSVGQSSGTLPPPGANWTNHGTISAQSGGNFLLTGASSATTPAWTNAAGHTISVSGGGSLTIQSSGIQTTGGFTWLNSGTLSETGSTITLGGVFTPTSLGTFNRSGGTVNLAGTLNNTGGTLLLNDTTGSWNLARGTINGGPGPVARRD